MRFVRLLCSFAAVSALLAAPASAQVLVLGEDGKVRRVHDPGVAAVGERTADRKVRASKSRRTTARAAKRRRTVVGELKRMRRAGAIDEGTYWLRRDEYKEAKRFARRLPAGRRRIEMRGVIALLDRMAAKGAMTVSRLEPLWLTLQANREWWSKGPLLGSGQRVRVDDSEIVWQYTPGQGISLHPLANFGKLNALWRAKRRDDQLEQLLDELLPLGVRRGKGIAWEYYFDYGGGRGPWVSAIAQGTALQSLARASIRLQRKEEVLPIARQGLVVFQTPPPAGVRLEVGDGAHYLMYSFNRDLRILNGFMQALVGLYDFGAYANDDVARALFADGDRAAQAEVPLYDTGYWSKYSLQRESDLGYHNLVTGFLGNLCKRTQSPLYCETEERFRTYLREAPVLQVLSRRLRGGRVSPLRFRLSKLSRVSVQVRRGKRLVLSRSATVGGGRRSFTWSVPRRRGRYRVRVAATDMAGNSASVKKTVEVLKPRK